MNKNKKGGFTLIELLVVIAIIGILSGIVLTSLGTARTKARDASAEASMSSMRAEAELGNISDGTYLADLCTASGQGSLTALITAVQGNVTPNTVNCVQNVAAGSRPSAWGASIQLNSARYFCVDSTGYAGELAANPLLTGGTAGNVTCL